MSVTYENEKSDAVYSDTSKTDNTIKKFGIRTRCCCVGVGVE